MWWVMGSRFACEEGDRKGEAGLEAECRARAAPNHRLQATANSLRSFLASAIGGA